MPPTLTPQAFIDKWRSVDLKERTASQSHFNDLCALLGVDDPITADPKGDWFTFEKGASKTTGGEGWADVWRRGCFAWEYKGKNKDLDKAFAQLQQYAIALENPPLLIVCDMERFRIHTNWTNTVQKVYEFRLEDLRDAATRDLLRAAFVNPDTLKPTKTRQKLTEEAAEKFAALALRLRARGHNSEAVAHFVNRLVFCLFAEDVGLLPNKMFQRMLEACHPAPASFQDLARTLFAAMRSGGMVGFERVDWFNGGLFDDDSALPLEKPDLADLLDAARLDWSEIDPSILGTLFERGLDPDKRSQLGAHYTDRDKIMLIVRPVVIDPLVAEWEAAKAEIVALLEKAASAKSPATRTRAHNDAVKLKQTFLERLKDFRVLDPACGSGNFLYLALLALKDIEHRVNLEAEAMGLPREFPRVGPEALLGIELNPYAAELARVSVWIGEIQWMRRNGFEASRNPILRPLNTIECADALLTPDGENRDWPAADVIIGNPPFLGGKLLRSLLGDEAVDRLFAVYEGRVPPEADFVCYWFVKAQEAMATGRTRLAGLVSTNSIRGGANRRVLEALADREAIFDAWDDEAWILNGAAVRVSMVCFARDPEGLQPHLDGLPVERIHADLTASQVNLTRAARLSQNADVAFMGDTKGGAFDIPGELAREWLRLPLNPNGRPNSDVLRPWMNGMDVTRRSAGKWIIDFGNEMSEADAALYEAPFCHVEQNVKPLRTQNKRDSYRRLWWRHVEPRPAMWQRIGNIGRFLVTPTVSKFRLFAWMQAPICPDHQLIAVARDDDTTFGILHSRFHELWALRMGTSLEDRPRYTPSTTFETFPFPEGLTPDIPAADYAADPRAQKIAAAAARLNELRENWLNPADLVVRVPEVVPGYPDRLLPKDEAAAKILKKRTLTNLYNERPAWLDNAHRALDGAVADAYGWGEDWAAGRLDEEEILARLFRLNQARAAAEAKAGKDA